MILWEKENHFGAVMRKYRQRQDSASWWERVCMEVKELPKDSSNIQSRTKRNNYFLWKFMDIKVKIHTNLISTSPILFDNLPLLLYKPIPSQ